MGKGHEDEAGQDQGPPFCTFTPPPVQLHGLQGGELDVHWIAILFLSLHRFMNSHLNHLTLVLEVSKCAT